MNIVDEFYNSNEVKQIQIKKEVQKKIKNYPLLTEMEKVVEEEVMNHDSDFYIHDVEMLINSEDSDAYLWIVRTNGTHLIPLVNDDFDSKGNWWGKTYFSAILSNYKNRLSGIYLIEKGQLSKINIKSALTQIAIYEDIAFNRRNLKLKGVI